MKQAVPDAVIGIDPGSHRTGWAILARRDGRLVRVASAVVTAEGLLGDRLVVMHHEIRRAVLRYRPVEAALEDVFHHRNARSAFVLGQARGVALLAVAGCAVPASFYAPAMVKRVVTGHGAADKRQVARVIAAVLGLERPPPADEADALAIAACHVLAGRAYAMLRDLQP